MHLPRGRLNDTVGVMMSIYTTLWALQFPRFGEFHIDCEWVTVIAQGIPAQITSTYALSVANVASFVELNGVKHLRCHTPP